MGANLEILITGLIAVLWGGSQTKPVGRMDVLALNAGFNQELGIQNHDERLIVPKKQLVKYTRKYDRTATDNLLRVVGYEWDLKGYTVSFRSSSDTSDPSDVHVVYGTAGIDECPTDKNYTDFRWLLNLNSIADGVDGKTHRPDPDWEKMTAPDSPIAARVQLSSGTVTPQIVGKQPKWAVRNGANTILEQAAASGILYKSTQAATEWLFEFRPLGSTGSGNPEFEVVVKPTAAARVVIQSHVLTSSGGTASTPHLKASYDLLTPRIANGARAIGMEDGTCPAFTSARVKMDARSISWLRRAAEFHPWNTLHPIQCPPPMIAK